MSLGFISPNSPRKTISGSFRATTSTRVRDILGFTDGVSIPVQCASDMNRQAMDYNGYHHDTMCNNVFCFAPTGKIYSAIYYPGSFHDSQVSVGLVNMVLEHLGP